jgi:hypothetical protein
LLPGACLLRGLRLLVGAGLLIVHGEWDWVLRRGFVVVAVE